MADNRSDQDRSLGTGRLPAIGAHGEAAILLVESLIHGLIARGGLSTAEAIEIIDDAAQVKADITAENGRPSDEPCYAVTLLRAISISLSHGL